MIETIRAPGPVEVKLGVVYLGSVCGKHKYTLLEEEDVSFARKFVLEAILDVATDGTGAAVFVTCKSGTGADQSTVQYSKVAEWYTKMESQSTTELQI